MWLAACLAQDTEVLLLDEPTTYLDLRHQVELLDLIRDLADHHGITVGVVLHDLNQAAAIADHLILLEAGRVAAAGRPDEVLTSQLLSRVYEIPMRRRPMTGSPPRTPPPVAPPSPTPDPPAHHADCSSPRAPAALTKRADPVHVSRALLTCRTRWLRRLLWPAAAPPTRPRQRPNAHRRRPAPVRSPSPTAAVSRSP